MKGKLTATMPVYLNAITGKGVHVVTVNEYLASRDASEMGELYDFLGLTVGLNLNSLSKEEKQEAYEQILHTGRIMNLVLTIYVTIWCFIKKKGFSVHFIMP